MPSDGYVRPFFIGKEINLLDASFLLCFDLFLQRDRASSNMLTGGVNTPAVHPKTPPVTPKNGHWGGGLIKIIGHQGRFFRDFSTCSAKKGSVPNGKYT